MRPTLFDFAGGEPAFLALASAHHARCLADPLHAYMRWAVDEVLSYSAKDAVVTPGAAMPRWGWDGLEPVSA
jgi:hypothetical protein